MRPNLLAFALSLLLALPSLADTEIRNFHLPLPGLPLTLAAGTDSLAKLSSTERQVQLSVSHVDPERYVLLDFGGACESWTVRLSWPGSSPTKFNPTLHPTSSPFQALLLIASSPLTPPFPHPFLRPLQPYFPSFFPLPPPAESPDTPVGVINGIAYNTTFHLVLEPLYLGVLPRTSLPAILWIVVFALGAAAAVPVIIRFIEFARLWAEYDEGSPEGKKRL